MSNLEFFKSIIVEIYGDESSWRRNQRRMTLVKV